MAYKKRKLASLGLISIEKRAVEYKRDLHTTRSKRNTDLGTVSYVRETQSLLLTLPDKITFKSQTQILAKCAS